MKPENVSLSQAECEKIYHTLAREPNEVEWQLFSALWSEHCSYKSSKKILEQLPREEKSVLVKAGEGNAGVIDVGKGWAVAFKMESHNHPSAVEPFQGAATGVGGILRDILAMGARPVFLMDSLRVGNLTSHRARHHLSEMVKGISHYGNCVGVPTMGGELFADDCYEHNPLVNVLCLGIVKKNSIQKSSVEQVGDVIVYVGAKTGREGLAGASFASQVLGEDKKNSSSIQRGDPFKGKCLIEACLEIFEQCDVVAVQDMGAAGLANAVAELVARGNRGAKLNLDRVPISNEKLLPHEILLSESQERMVFVLKPDEVRKIKTISKRWGLETAILGEVIVEEEFQACFENDLVAKLPIKFLVKGFPLKEKVSLNFSSKKQVFQQKRPSLDCRATLLEMLALPSIASKRWIFEQFDYHVGNATQIIPGSDAAVVRLRLDQDEIFLAATMDGNGWYCHLDPFEGTQLLVAESARNLCCVGARPLAVTNNLNFGNPQNLDRFLEFQESVKGLAEACCALDIPVISGNVSFYNESSQGGVFPTPVIGMVGKIEREKDVTTVGFKKPGDSIALIGGWGEALESSYCDFKLQSLAEGKCPKVSWEKEKVVQSAVLEAIQNGLIKSAHDCSEGGLAVALAECCLIGDKLGASIEINEENIEAVLFNESPSRVVISFDPTYEKVITKLCKEQNVPIVLLGEVGGESLMVRSSKHFFEWSIVELSKSWEQALSRSFS
ncbi:MAG: phosphoribosylformylglycinamidine synthase subunit PurL [Verrucomicrobiae bacterium]|nr:phosphoribosylformylglycinamidine synthase subunit PurL [Verrucomicrobiae bacterium]